MVSCAAVYILPKRVNDKRCAGGTCVSWAGKLAYMASLSALFAEMQGIPVLQCMDLAHHNFTLVTHMQVPVHIVFWAAPVHWHNTNGALQCLLGGL